MPTNNEAKKSPNTRSASKKRKIVEVGSKSAESINSKRKKGDVVSNSIAELQLQNYALQLQNWQSDLEKREMEIRIKTLEQEKRMLAAFELMKQINRLSESEKSLLSKMDALLKNPPLMRQPDNTSYVETTSTPELTELYFMSFGADSGILTPLRPGSEGAKLGTLEEVQAAFDALANKSPDIPVDGTLTPPKNTL